MVISNQSADSASIQLLNHRASIYGLLSTGFLFPDEAVERFFRQELVAHKTQEPGTCAMSVFTAFLNSQKFRDETLTSSYNKLFHLDGGISLYESEHRCQHEFQKAENLADIMGFYYAFGVEPNGERPDHISTELDFMRYLLFKEGRAIESGNADHRAVTVDAERKFFADHLFAWSETLLDLIAQRAERDSFYYHLAQLFRTFLKKEQLRLMPERLQKEMTQ